MDSPANDPEMQKLIAMEVADIMGSMTTPTNWPNPERPGVPLFPERDGLHVVLGPFDEMPVLILWRAQDRTYIKGRVVFTPDDLLAGAIMYHGPVLTPTQIAEMLAGEREKIAEWISPQRNDIPATGQEFAAAIRNLGDAP